MISNRGNIPVNNWPTWANYSAWHLVHRTRTTGQKEEDNSCPYNILRSPAFPFLRIINFLFLWRKLFCQVCPSRENVYELLSNFIFAALSANTVQLMAYVELTIQSWLINYTWVIMNDGFKNQYYALQVPLVNRYWMSGNRWQICGFLTTGHRHSSIVWILF